VETGAARSQGEKKLCKAPLYQNYWVINHQKVFNPHQKRKEEGGRCQRGKAPVAPNILHKEKILEANSGANQGG